MGIETINTQGHKTQLFFSLKNVIFLKFSHHSFYSMCEALEMHTVWCSSSISAIHFVHCNERERWVQILLLWHRTEARAEKPTKRCHGGDEKKSLEKCDAKLTYVFSRSVLPLTSFRSLAEGNCMILKKKRRRCFCALSSSLHIYCDENGLSTGTVSVVHTDGWTNEWYDMMWLVSKKWNLSIGKTKRTCLVIWNMARVQQPRLFMVFPQTYNFIKKFRLQIYWETTTTDMAMSPRHRTFVVYAIFSVVSILIFHNCVFGAKCEPFFLFFAKMYPTNLFKTTPNFLI